MNKPEPRPTFCAACTEYERADRPETKLQPRAIGRNGGMVWLCQDCDPDHVDASGKTERSA